MIIISATIDQIAFDNFKTNPFQERLLKEAGIDSPADPMFKDVLKASLDFCYHAELFLPDPNDPSKPLHLEDWQREELEYAQYGEITAASRALENGKIRKKDYDRYFTKDGVAKRKKVAINSPRGFGKSVLASVIPVEYAVHFPYTKIALFSTSQEQANELMNKVKHLLNNSILAYMVDKKNDSKSEIGLINGSVIKSFPQSEVTIRGYHPHIKIIDEKSRIKREILESAIRPMGRKTCWLEIGISTPFGRNNNHYEDCHNPDSFHIRNLKATEVSWVDKEKLQTEMKVMGERIARQELFGEFLEDADAVFKQSWIQNMFYDTLKPQSEGRANLSYVMGADFGKNHDYTAIFIGHMNPKNYIQIDWAERHLNWDYVTVLNRIVQLTRLFNIRLIVPDGKGVGIALLDMLEKQTKVPIYRTKLKKKNPSTGEPEEKKGFIFTNQSKLNLVGETERVMMNNILWCPFHNNSSDPFDDFYIYKVLENEMLNFTYTRTIEGNIRFSHPEDGKSHDDTLIALMLMIWGFKYLGMKNIEISSKARYGFGSGDKLIQSRR